MLINNNYHYYLTYTCKKTVICYHRPWSIESIRFSGNRNCNGWLRNLRETVIERFPENRSDYNNVLRLFIARIALKSIL